MENVNWERQINLMPYKSLYRTGQNIPVDYLHFIGSFYLQGE